MLASVVFQLLYPANRTLPFAHVNGQPVGGVSVDRATKSLEKYYRVADITLLSDDKTITKSLEQIGIDIDARATAKVAADYPFWRRLIPFSAAAQVAFGNPAPVVHMDEDRFEYFVQTAHDELFVPARNAGVAVKDGQAALDPARPSKDYAVSTIARAIKQANLTSSTKLRLRPSTHPPARSNDQVKSVLADAQKVISTSLTLSLPSEKVTVDKTTIGSWLDFPEDTGTMKLSVSIKPEAVAAYLATIQSKIDKAPGTVTVSLLDGGEISRSGNSAGRGLDTAKAVSMIQKSLNDQSSDPVALPVVTIPATVVYSRSYSNTQVGLSALLKDVAAAKGGFGLAVIELDGQGRSASANGSKQFVAASTYKLPVAYAVFKKIAAGQMQWTDTINGKSASDCFEAMIVRSDNPCAKAFGEQIGWSNVQTMAQGIGMTSTTFAPFYTSADDLALFMRKLQNGTLVSTADRDRLVSAMKRQIYRSGIPAGTGVIVADKVGFIDGYLNDAGIVYGPKGTYVMVVLSSGSSWAQVADAAKQIHQFLSR